MLSTEEIIELYDKEEYDIIIDKLKIISQYDTKSKCILGYAIFNFHIELFTIACTINNLNQKIISLISNKPRIWPQFIKMISMDPILCNHVEEIINFGCIYHSAKFLKNIIHHVSIDSMYLEELFYDSIRDNDLETIHNILLRDFNFKLDFHRIFMSSMIPNINIGTYIFLEEHNIPITPYINNIGTKYCCQNNIDGIIFCLNYGADINYLLKEINTDVNLATIKFLIEHGADINLFNVLNLMYYNNPINLDIVKFIVDMGIDITTYLDKFILYSINSNSIEAIIYFINMGCDIHIHDELFLFFAVERHYIDIIKILLDNGADIYARNNSILLFNSDDLFTDIMCIMTTHMSIPASFIMHNYKNNNLNTFKYLLKIGAVITEVDDIRKYYLRWVIDEESLIYFLDLGFDLNKRISANEKTYQITSILEYAIYRNDFDIVKLFLKYGADPSSNNYGPIKMAIYKNDAKIISLLAVDIPADILELVEQYKSTRNKKLIY